MVSKVKFLHYPRFYGEPKLKKPKELKNIKQVFAVDYIPKKCTCGVFIKGNDVWIKHRDYFSDTMELPAEDIGKPLEYLANKYCDIRKSSNFIYSDAWGSIVLRNEAWVHLKDVLLDIRTGVFELDIVNNICRQQEMACGFDEYELVCTPMERFWEKVVHQLEDSHRDVSPGQCALGGLLADPSGRHAGDQRCSDGPGP